MTDTRTAHAAAPSMSPSSDPRCLGEIDARVNLTRDEFVEEYFKPQLPVILKGHVNGWRAMKEWNLDFLRARWGHVLVPTGRCFEFSRLVPLGEYVDYMEARDSGPLAGEDPALPPMFMEGWYFNKNIPEIECPEVGEYYDAPEFFEEDLFERSLFKAFDPKAQGILMTAKGGFTKLHYDQLATHSWNAHIIGRKKWIMFSPEQLKDSYPEVCQAPGYDPGFHVDRPDFSRFPNMRKIRYYQAVAEPGDLVFIPAMWMHEVTSLDATVGITHNYLSTNNLLRFAKMFIAYRRDLRRKKKAGIPLSVYERAQA